MTTKAQRDQQRDQKWARAVAAGHGKTGNGELSPYQEEQRRRAEVFNKAVQAKRAKARPHATKPGTTRMAARATTRTSMMVRNTNRRS